MVEIPGRGKLDLVVGGEGECGCVEYKGRLAIMWWNFLKGQ